MLSFWPTFFCFFFFFLLLSPPLTVLSDNNISLLGDASINNGAISLTQELGSVLGGVGRAFYRYPIRFLDPISNSTASFFTRFSFSITPSPSLPFGDGLAFFITSNARSISNSAGYIGLPNTTINGVQESFIAVELDTSFDPSLGDINDNHIGIDVGTVVSFDSVDAGSMGIDLKSGKPMKAWIEYKHEQKMMRVWIDYSRIRPLSPVLATKIDLSEKFREFMHVGFSASNGIGAARHLVERWQFRTFGFNQSEQEDRDENDEAQEDGENGCLMCSPDDLNSDNGRTKLSELGLGLGGGAALLFSVVVIITATIFHLIRKRRVSKERRQILQICRTETQNLPKRFSLAQLKSATRGFHPSRIIGNGASGTVYEGLLASGREVAVKKFIRINQIIDDPFRTELTAMVSLLKHKNLVQLQGWCCEGNELILVYEYLPRGSLDKVLHKTSITSSPLTWEQRHNIIVGVASALAYLHEECERQIIHRDVKACNIMLDEEFNAKLGDFNLAELHDPTRPDLTRDTSIPVGTMGYLAPEYVHLGVATEKTDVYSFGVVALEVVSGRRPLECDGSVMVDWVWKLWREGRVMQAVDRRLKGRFEWGGVERVLMVGLWCVHPNSAVRPVMKEVVRMLRGEAEVAVLPARRPEVRVSSWQPETAREVMMVLGERSGGGGGFGTPWSTPRTHFS